MKVQTLPDAFAVFLGGICFGLGFIIANGVAAIIARLFAGA